MQTLATLTRHGITYLVGILTAWLAVYLTAPEELKTATEAANALVEPLVILIGFVAVILSRLAMPALNKIFRRGAGEDSANGTGLAPLVAIGTVIGMTAAVGGLLPSCSTGPVSGAEYPVTGFVSYTDPQTGAQVGVNIGQAKKAKKAKAPKVIAAK
jgi:hypothetical protein